MIKYFSPISSSVEAKFDEILQNRHKYIAYEIEKAKNEAKKNFGGIKDKITEIEAKVDPVTDKIKDQLKDFETF